MLNKKAYFFSLDALIALAIILSIILVLNPVKPKKQVEMDLQEDMISVLSSIKIGEIDNAYVQQLISEGTITDLNQSILEQIGEFYASGMPEANLLAQDIIDNLNFDEEIGIWFNNELLASKNSSPIEDAKQIWTARQLISGIEKGAGAKGYSARAFLSRASRVKYFYFGGYIGDGNITAKLSYSGTIKDAQIEATFSNDFDLYINGNYVNHYSPVDILTPMKINLSSVLSYFSPEDNYIEFKGENLYIGGGLIRISYDDSDPFSLPTRHPFPGIEGIINLYDSFYIPGNLNVMEIYLHYDSDYNLFLIIGNKTIFNKTSSGENILTVSDAELQTMLDYSELSKKTIPLRFGLSELRRAVTRGNADVVLITDLSGSMRYQLDSFVEGIERDCNDPNLYDASTKRISLAKCLDKQVVDAILNVSGNRMALSAFSGPNTYNEDLTNNSEYLKSRIDAYSESSGTCICCSINVAYNILNEGSNESRMKFIIVMSDGIPTHRCTTTGCEGTGTYGYFYGGGCWGAGDDCNVNDCWCPSDNANYSSCRAHDELNATVYSIGFGPVADCWMANKTLRAIADCGHGKYYASDNATILEEFYSSISEEILELSYIEQVAEITGELNKTILYPDSYISLSYEEEVPYGLAITLETHEFGNTISEGTFNVPEDSEILEANVISYSGPKWTDKVFIQNQIYNTSWEKIFDLEDYGEVYVELGDPYVINIPTEKISQGDNIIRISTASSPGNYSGGSASDKIIYTLLKEVSSYSPIVATAEGCIWTVEFEDNTIEQLTIPTTYTGTDQCAYTSSSIAYNNNDAIDYAIYILFSILDLNDNNKIETKFLEQDLSLITNEISGIPFTWDSEVQVRVWR